MRTRLAALTITTTLLTTISMIGAPATAFADEIRDSQWYLDSFDIDKVHELSQGAGVTIGVIDSGIDPDHPDLEGNVKPGKGFGSAAKDGLSDDIGHGTAVSSVLAGHGHGEDGAEGVMGIAPKASIIPVAFNWEKDPGSANDAMGEAIEWLLDQDVDIITTSISASPSNEADNAIKAAAEQGVPFVASAGNRKTTSFGGQEFDETSTAYPAIRSGVIPVSGTTPDGTFWEDGRDLKNASTEHQLGLSAPGKNIPIALPDGKYDTVNGTSFSAPIVAGTLALIKSAYPDLDTETWMARMIETVDDKGREGYDDKYGWGIVDPYAALSEDVKFQDAYDTIESKASEILPLDQQGEGSDDVGSKPGEGSESSDSSDDVLISGPSTEIPLWAIISLGAASVAIIAIVILVIRSTRRPQQNQLPVPHQPEVPQGSFIPPGSGNGR